MLSERNPSLSESYQKFFSSFLDYIVHLRDWLTRKLLPWRFVRHPNCRTLQALATKHLGLSLLWTFKQLHAAIHRCMPLSGHANENEIDAAFRLSAAWAEMTCTNTVNIRSDTLATQNACCSSYPQILAEDNPENTFSSYHPRTRNAAGR